MLHFKLEPTAFRCGGYRHRILDHDRDHRRSHVWRGGNTARDGAGCPAVASGCLWNGRVGSWCCPDDAKDKGSREWTGSGSLGLPIFLTDLEVIE